MINSHEHIKKFDKTAFENLFREYFIPLTGFIKKYVRDIDNAKEIAHEVFINLWSKREDIDLEKSVKSYLYTSAYNRSLNYIRDHKKFDTNVSIESSPIQNISWHFEDNLETIELEEKINRIIFSLPEKCKQVFLLSRFEGLKYQEIADKLGISVKTVETQMSKALSVLKTNLKEYLTIVILLLISH